MNEPKFQENQVVKIKSYEEMKADEYHLLYSDERLKEVAQAEVAIYKVINDLRAVTWYEVGQCGHNVIEIPETYIKGVVNFDEAPNAPDDSYERNFCEFSNMIKSTVCSGEYKYRDLAILLKESLKELESREIKELDESIDSLCVRKFLVVPELSFSVRGNNEASVGFIRGIIVNTGKEELPYTYQDVLKMIERQLEMFSTRWYGGKLRTDGLISCIKEMEDINSKLKTELYKYIDKDGLPCNSDLVTLSTFAIQTIIYLENPKEKDNKILSKPFYDITSRMFSIYEQKQKNSYNLFLESLEEDGIIIAKIRIGDGIKKYSYLIKDGANSNDGKEALVDVLISIANYCVMTIMWMDKQRNNQPNK